MSSKLSIWNTGKTKTEVAKRWKTAMDSRRFLEDRWLRNERTLFATTSGLNAPLNQNSMDNSYTMGMPGIDNSDLDVSVSYVFKNFRFIHAQMSANPPSVVMRPSSSDQEDHRKASAADKVIRWAIRKYAMQEKSDQQNLHTLTYGSGFIKTIWDATLGDIIDFDPETEEVKTEGDISVTIPFIWNVFMDPDAKCWADVKWVFERVYLDYDEACARWPDKKELLEGNRLEAEDDIGPYNKSSALDNKHYNVVELLEYWETGLPSNGYMGRYCVTTTDGDEIEKCRPNPFRFKQAGSANKIEAMDAPDEAKAARIARMPEKARLPYHLLTDIDVPNLTWGRSSIEYVAGLQDNLNRLDTARIDNIAAHSAARLVVPKGSEVTEMGNTGWDVTEVEQGIEPHFISPPQTMPDMTPMRLDLVAGIDNGMGVNESMFGQQSREQSGASMQYATNQGNMVRRRLFNKYVANIESVYKAILDLCRKHWTVERTISVLGKEKALEAVDLKGADIDGGYDVVAEYGVSLSLDPTVRREEIMMMMPLFEQADLPKRKLLEMMRLNELDGMYDKLEIAGTRQKEIFDEMVATEMYLAPEPMMDQENMIAWGMDYFMTSEFNMLAPEIKVLLKQHITKRGQLAATESPAPPAAAPTPMAPAGPPPGPPVAQ